MKIFRDEHMEIEYTKLLVENALLKDALLKMESLNERLMALVERLTNGNYKV